MVASECTPFAKIGGLADVVGTLPPKLNKAGLDCRVILPLYRQIKDEYVHSMKFLRWTTIKMGWRAVYCGVFSMEHEGVQFYFIDNEFYFNTDTIYTEYSYDIERYSFFQRAVLDCMGSGIDFFPDIVHCHDWQAGMIPCLLDAHYKPHGYFVDVKTVYTIHNLKYQGIHGVEQIADFMDLPSTYFTEYGVLKDGVPNFMKAGIVYSDFVTTVSPTYAKEIFMPFYGEGLDATLRNFSYKVKGILNGIDMDTWNPMNDPFLDQKYSVIDWELGKQTNKLAMQRFLGLKENKDVPLITFISRLVDQKGIDLILHVIDELAAEDCQIIMMGTGDQEYEDLLRQAGERHHHNVRSMILYSNELSHKVYAAGDIFLMPSIFEPCGLSQMIAMRYGNVPLVRETGGLKDTVFAYNPETKEGNGFSFPNINAHDMLFLLKDAMRMYRNQKDHWKIMVERGMTMDLSWDRSAADYKALYDELLSY